MKVLVVDDELPIRKWIAATLEKITEPPIETVETAANGAEALEILRRDKPDIILADIKMPVMDGMTLLRRVKEIDEHVVVVILTCHEEFSYAREAVSEKAYDYILKMEITPVKLKNLLKRIQGELEKQTNSDKWITLQAQRDCFLTKLLNSPGFFKEDDIREALAGNHIFLKENALFAIAFHRDGFLSEKMKAAAESIQDDRVDNLIFYSYNNQINVAVGNIVNVPSLLYQKNIQYEFARKLSVRFQSAVGVSDLYYNLSRIPDMIFQSVHVLNLEFYDGWNIYNISSGCSFAQAEEELEKLKAEILSSVNEGQYTIAGQKIEKIYERLKQTPVYDIDLLKLYFISIITGFVLKVYADTPLCFIEKMNYYQMAVQRADNLSQVKKNVEELCAELKNAMHYEKPFYTQHITKAIDCLEKNYKEAGNVAEMADYVGLNSEYFCRLFKKETGVTFTQYLTNIRMNKAVYLLQNSDLKLYNIAENVGYSNLSYFSKTFKKRFDITPFEFRNNIKSQFIDKT